jgi:hypothetical protein
MRRRVRHPEQRPELAHGQVRPPVRRHQQHPISQVQPPLPTGPAISDLFLTPPGHHPHYLAELTGLQARERGNPL